MDSLYFCVNGRIPSKKNNKQIRRRRNGQRFVGSSDDYVLWEKRHVAELMKWRGMFKGKRVSVEILYRSETNRAWDLTNKTEGIMDALAKAEVIDDDCVQVVPHLALRWLGKAGQDVAEVTIKTLQDGKSLPA